MNTPLTVPEELSVLDQSIYLARHINIAVDILRPLVYRVFAENLWEGHFSSFGEYVESPSGLGKSQGYASRLKSVEEYYIIESGMSPEDISGLDQDKLYELRKFEATPQEKVCMARTLTRQEIKEMRNDKEITPHAFARVCYCSVCGLSEERHP